MPDDPTAVRLQQFEHTAEFEGDANGASVSFILKATRASPSAT